MKPKILICAAFTLLSMFSCSSDEAEPQTDPEEQQINKLAKAWTPGTITYGSDDVTDRFDGFVLTFTKNKSYTATGSLGDYDYEPFEPGGTWDFAEGNLNVINRNDGVIMDVQVGENSLVLTFSVSEENGRIKGLGSYRFDLVSN